MRVTALPTSGACSRAYASRTAWERWPVMPHDLVRVGAGPEGLGDEPGPQGVPAQLPDLGGGVAGLFGAAADHLVHRVPAHGPVPDHPGAVHRREQRPPRIRRFGQPGRPAHMQPTPALLTVTIPGVDHLAVGGLPAQHPHHRGPPLLRRGGVGGVQQFPPPGPRARRTGRRVPPVGQRHDPPGGLLVGLAAAQCKWSN
jgi:hypothetical protein